MQEFELVDVLMFAFLWFGIGLIVGFKIAYAIFGGEK
jgi:hypothetical protein